MNAPRYDGWRWPRFVLTALLLVFPCPFFAGRAFPQSYPIQPAVGQVGLQRILKYGQGPGEIGITNSAEQAPVGPESFAVARDGSILIADVANHRVSVFSEDGTFLRQIEFSGTILGDVTVDDKMRIYIYDQGRDTLQLRDPGGTFSTLNLKPQDINTRGYFHVVNTNVYFADAAARDVLVATVGDGQLQPPPALMVRTVDGIHGDSGLIYSVSLERGRSLRLQTRNAATPATTCSTEVLEPGIVSARYVGEDSARQFYVQTERLAGADIVLEVLAFTPAGQPLATTRIPENDYAFWTTKLVDVGPDGTIVQFLPEQGQAKLNLFAK